MKNIPIIFYKAAIFICMGLLTACTEADYSDDFKPGSPPPIGDYNNSDEVAAASQAAKWSFEDNLTESKQNLAGTNHGTTFSAGQKGKALQGSQTGYVDYPSAGPALSNLKSFTVSFWMKLDTFFCCGATQVFHIDNTNDFWYNLAVYFEARGADDSLRFKIQFHKEGVAFNNQFIEAHPDKEPNIIGKWTNFVAVYDGTTSTFRAYMNNRKFFQSTPLSGPSGPPLGELAFANVGRLVFGTWKQKIGGPGDTWMQNFRGSVDEFRIYNKGLTDLEISSLYQLEKQGR
ncbi:LamG domain-containing protein [Chitinophagaceae bacterium LB-8]|uniref:LamG domain-containing protein n=1 Tax=Paraflavisolibacter caeni TaxID=2982496 RepID=A0A9X2XXC8_9BACT|nr:LamG-like jellyroll fold domain-containing protein [Paraflavisolibacter caeni]MCU7550690.1 LamG domain-containing protein [Paraflavisolibacter caeni]